MQDKLKELTEFHGLYNHWKDLVSKLEKKDISIIITDLDDCLYSRNEQLEWSETLRTNRWDEWTKKIFNEIWLNKYIKDWFTNKPVTQEIVSQLNQETDLILTAGVLENQLEKVSALWLDIYNLVAVESWKDKIIATIRYVIFNLWYIPSSITIYEDRPEYFIEYRDLIQDILWTNLIIQKVVLNWDNWVTQITKI